LLSFRGLIPFRAMGLTLRPLNRNRLRSVMSRFVRVSSFVPTSQPRSSENSAVARLASRNVTGSFFINVFLSSARLRTEVAAPRGARCSLDATNSGSGKKP
jgi:hypothetical protein